MKSLKTNAIITGIRSRVDKSLGLSISTPELTVEEKSLFLELQGLNVNLLIEPLDGSEALHKVTEKIEGKSPSNRLRSVIFIFWTQMGRKGDFEIFYRERMEKMISQVKEYLI